MTSWDTERLIETRFKMNFGQRIKVLFNGRVNLSTLVKINYNLGLADVHHEVYLPSDKEARANEKEESKT